MVKDVFNRGDLLIKVKDIMDNDKVEVELLKRNESGTILPLDLDFLTQ